MYHFDDFRGKKWCLFLGLLKRRYFDASKTTCAGDGQIWPNYWAIKILTQLATMKNLSATRPCFGFAAIKVYHTEIRGRL